MEEESPTLMMDKVEPPKKAKEVTATTTKAALVMPLEDESLAQVVKEAPNKVEAMEMPEEEQEEVPKKVVTGGQEKEDIGLNGKGGSFWSQEVKNDEAEGDGGASQGRKMEEAEECAKGVSSSAVEEPALQDTEATICVFEPTPPLESNDAEDIGGATEVVDQENKVDNDDIIEDVIDVDDNKVEGDKEGGDYEDPEMTGEDPKARTLDVGEAVKDVDSRKLVAPDAEIAVPMVELGLATEHKLERSELGKDNVAMASHDVLECEDKGELWKEKEEKVVSTVEEKVADKMKNDVKVVVTKEETSYEDGGESGEKKEVEVSIVNVEAIKLGDEVALFGGGELGYEKEGSDNIPKESTTKDVDVEDEVTKLELASEVVHGGSIEEIYPTSIHSVLENSCRKEQNAKGQINASEVVEEVGVEKPLEIENVAVAVEDIDFEKPTEIENIAIKVDDIDVENPMEDENIIASDAYGIFSRELAKESSKEKNNVEETEIVNHEEKIDDDGIIGALTRVKEAKGDRGADEGGEVVKVEEVAKGEVSCAVEELTLQDTEAIVIVLEPMPIPLLGFNDVEDTEGASEVGNHENKLDDDDIIKNVTSMIDVNYDKVEGDGGGDNDGGPEVVEEDAKARTLDVGEVVKDDNGRAVVAQHVEVEVPAVELAPVVEYKLERRGLGEEDATMAFPNVPEVKDKGELWKESEEKVVAIVKANVMEKMTDDVIVVVTEKKSKPEGEKVEEVGYRGGDGGEREEEEVEVSTIGVEATKLRDEVAPFSGDLGYEKEKSSDILIVGGEKAPEESINRDVDVEHEVAKPELESVVAHAESVEEVYPSSAQSVLENSHGKEQNAEGQTNTSEVVEEVGVDKPIEIKNVVDVVEDISFDKPIEIENVAIEVESIDVENPMEVENDVASSVVGILSRELAPQSSEENNNVEKIECATEVVNHEKEIDDDYTIDAMTNIIYAKNDEVVGDEGGDDGMVLEEYALGGTLGAVEAVKDDGGTKPMEQDTEVVNFGVQPTPAETLEPKSGNSELEEKEDAMVSPDALEGGDKCELKKERDEMEEMDTYKLIDNANTTVVGEKKQELKREKGEQLDNGGGDGGKLGYEKKASNDIVVLEGEEFQVESIEEYVYVEDVAAKHDPVSKASTKILHDGSIDEVDPASRDSVLEDSPKKDQNVDGQADESKMMEDIGVNKPVYVEANIEVENISVEKPIEIENVDVVVENVNVEKPMEVENVVASSADGIISQELATKSSKENNDAEETEDDTKVFNHEEKVPDDNIIEVVTNVTDAENDKVDGDGERGDGGVVEEAKEDAKDKSLDKKKATKDDSGTEPTLQDKKGAISMVELAPMLPVESKLENSEFGEEGEDAKASPDAIEGEDKDELQEEKKVGVMVEAKVEDIVADDANYVVDEEEKLEPKGEKSEEVGYEGGEGDELGEEKEVEPSIISIETTKVEYKAAPFIEGSGKLDYDKEVSDDVVGMGGEEVVKESIEKDIDVENVATKTKSMIEVVHDGSVEVVDPTRVDRVLKDSIGKEQIAEGQATVSEVLEDVSAEKIIDVENVAAMVEDIGIEKSTEVQNIFIEVEGVDVKESMEDEDIAAPSAGDILSLELAPKSNKEKNDVMKTEGATEVIDHEEEIEDDGIIKALINVTNTENDEIESDRGRDDDWKVQDMEGETKDMSLDVVEDVKNNDEKEPMVQDVEVVISVVEPVLVLVVEPQSENSELGEENATMDSLDALEGEDKGEFWEEREEEEVGDVVEMKIAYKVRDDAKVAVVEQDKPKPEGGKNDEIGYEGGDSEELSEEKEANVSTEADEPDKVALFSKDKGVLNYKKEASNDITVVGDEETLEEPIMKDVAIENEAAKPKPASEASIEVVHDGGVVEVDLASAYSVLEDNLDKEQNAEGVATPSKAMEDVSVKKSLADENIIVAVEDIGVDKPIEVENIVISTEGIDIDKPVKVENVVVSNADSTLFQELAQESSIENNNAKEMKGATKVVDHEDEVSSDNRIKAEKDDEDGVGNEVNDGTNSNASGSLDINITFESQDDSRILIMDRPGDLGSSASSLQPTPPHQTAQSKILNTSKLALSDDHTEEMNKEDEKLNNKVELIRVKFLHLVYRLGATLEEPVVAQVMYRLSLAESTIHGWQMNRTFNFDNAQKKASILEAEGKQDLDFSCNILVLGKTGVGKSATINSIFGEEKLKTDAFSSATTGVQEIVGDVHGIKIRIIDTPGLLPNVMDQASNRKILDAVKKYTKRCPPDVVLYVDRLDCLSHDLNDLPLLKTITDIFGSSIWFNAIVALTHAASPPEGLNGTPMPYEVLMAQSSHIIQQSIRQATRDMRLVNPVALVENLPFLREHNESEKVLPNDQSWRHQILLLFYSAKILSEANSLLKLQDPNPEKHSRFHFRSQPLHFMLSSLLQSRAHPKLSIEQSVNEGENDQDPPPKSASVPLPVMVLPPSFDCDNPTYRYRFLETTSTVLARPILDAHGWDQDCGYDGISMEDTLSILNKFPGNVEVQVTKNKKEFSIHLDSSISAKHGDNASSLAGFDIQTVGNQLAYILHGETKIKNIKKNKTTGGFSVTFLGDIVATGLKVEDQISLGKRLSLVASTGAMQAQGDTAYGANLEARLKDKDYPIGWSLSTLGLSLMKWRQNLALGVNLQSQFSIGRGSKMALHLGLNNKQSGKITVKTSTSEQVQIALLGLVSVAASIYKSFRPNEP